MQDCMNDRVGQCNRGHNASFSSEDVMPSESEREELT